MPRGYCPACETLVGITPTAERRHPTRGTDRWWLVDLHKVDGKPEICEGSGAKV